MADGFLSAPLRDSFALFAAFKRREPDAMAEVRAMFSADAECFLCAEPAGASFDLYVGQDPAHAASAILAPLCQQCMSLPLLNRMHRLRQLLRAMFPLVNPRNIGVLSPNQVRAFIK